MANSRKHAGRCIAGREWSQGGVTTNWVRPVSEREGHEVSQQERRYHKTQVEPENGDVFDLTLKTHAPHECQVENWILDSKYSWSFRRKATWEQISKAAETPSALWINGDSTQAGMHDQIQHGIAEKLSSSLCMVHVAGVELHVCVPGINYGNTKKRVQARFQYRNVSYWLWITDASLEATYLTQPVGTYSLGECCITVSLSEPDVKSNGTKYVYKLVAAIIIRP